MYVHFYSILFLRVCLITITLQSYLPLLPHALSAFYLLVLFVPFEQAFALIYFMRTTSFHASFRVALLPGNVAQAPGKGVLLHHETGNGCPSGLLLPLHPFLILFSSHSPFLLFTFLLVYSFHLFLLSCFSFHSSSFPLSPFPLILHRITLSCADSQPFPVFFHPKSSSSFYSLFYLLVLLPYSSLHPTPPHSPPRRSPPDHLFLLLWAFPRSEQDWTLTLTVLVCSKRSFEVMRSFVPSSGWEKEEEEGKEEGGE